MAKKTISPTKVQANQVIIKKAPHALIRDLLPILAGRITLAEFTAVCLALGLVGPPRPEQFLQVLQEEAGNVSATARRLRVCTKTIYRWARASGFAITAARRSVNSGASEIKTRPP